MALSLPESSLRVNVLDAPGSVKQGIIPGVLSFRRTRSLNQVGGAEITFSTPSVRNTALVQPGRRYYVYHQQYGLIGSYIHRSHTVSGDQAVTTIQSDDLLKLWARRTTKMNRRYGDTSFGGASAITTIVQAVTDLTVSMNTDPTYISPDTWTASIFDPTNTLAGQAIAVDFQGQTMFEALDALRKLTRSQFRINDSSPHAPILEFGNFFTGQLSLYGSARYGIDPYFGNITSSHNLYATNTEFLSRNQESTYGQVVAITVIYGGDHYATGPTVTIAPPTTPGGVTATAVAVLDTTTHKVTHIVIKNPGSGYTTSPAVTISGGTPTPGAAPGDLLLEDSGYLLKEDTGKFILEGTGFSTIIPARAFSFVGSDMIIVTDCQITMETDKVVNRAIVLGAGDGLNQFTMERTYLGYPGHKPPASTYSYVVQRGLNPDGETYYYYLEDSASIGNYGLFEDVLALPSIRPLTNSETSQLLASDALYYVGAAYLTTNKAPATIYTIQVKGLPPSARPGDVIFFRYVGQASYTDDTGTDTYRYIDVSAAAVIMDITETFNANGSIDAQLTISTNGERGVTETDVIIGTQQSINAVKVSVQPYPCRDSITARQELAPNFPMEFIVPVENEVLNVLKATITLVTKPFRSVINPDLSGLDSVTLPPTTPFSFYGDPNSDPSTWVSTENLINAVATRYTDAPNGNYGRVRHSHGFAIIGGFNYTGASTNGVPDGWYLTWGGGDINVGSAYTTVGNNGKPPWAGATFQFGDGAGRGFTSDTSHYHQWHLPHHFHTLPATQLHATLSFGIYDDLAPNNLPTGVSVIVNGFLVTTLANPGSAPITLDISNEIQKTAGNLIHIEASGGRGQIEATVRLFLSVQATLPTLG